MRIALESLFKYIALFFINTNYRKFIWLAIRLGFKKRYEKATVSISGLKFKIPDAKSFIWQYHEIFGNESYKFKTEVSQPIIYDCGSNVGTSVLYLKQLYPSSIIHAFEPDPSVFEFLQSNIENNKMDGVVLHKAAAWTEDTTLQFSSEGADAGKVGAQNTNAISVQAINLKSLLEKEQRVDFLKIDIEGAEYEVLEHCQDALSKVQNIFVECHSYNASSQKIASVLSILNKQGFRYYIHNESIRKSPFINRKKEQQMDMQLNIFAYRSN